ncbi:MAG: MFS transporter [Clostridia bacterium]|nr:MFS transporter [Clostridia bacterium]
MADNNTQTQFEGLNTDYVYENRRYVGRKETVGFVLWDAAQSFNIDKYTDRFITNIVQVDLSLQMIEQAINGVWDIVNDIFMGAIVDRTRTRWGKFKPYLLLLAIPGLIGTCLYWLMPLIFEGRTSMDLTKFIFYFLLAFIREGIGTFQTISRNGMMATITPHPVDRTRLITLANFASGTFGEKLPEQITTVILDLIDNSVFKTKKSTLYLTTFVGMGVFTTFISSGMSMWYFMNSRERVMQSVEKPDIMQGVKSIINNKPILLLTLSDFLGGFSIGGSKSDYYIDVLHLASMTMITGIAAAPVSPISYAYVPFLRRHFSSRFLYISSNYISTFLNIAVFGVGIIGMNWKTKKGGIYQSTIGMLIVMSIYELIWTLFYGTKSVIGTEMYNESMDYCEWKNGYRTEAMTSVAKGIASKVSSKVSSLVRTWLKNLIKYDQTAYISGKEQTDSVKFYLFAMFTIIPAITGSLGIIPMLFYDLDGKKKEIMYAELLERRAALQKAADEGDTTALASASKEQLESIENRK